uniref:Sulfotransferase n=1 Tax=Cyprinus carpio TaxID=7962 RepID=A0A8C2FNH1_CYPCA
LTELLRKMTEAELYSVYKGVYLPTHLHPAESLKYCEEFTFRPDDILIVTYPKSGTTWMQEVVPLIVSEGDLTPVLTVPNWDRVPWLEEHRAILLNLEQRPSPRVFPHTACALFNEMHSDYCVLHSVLQVLYVMRNPKDVFTSSYHYYGMASYLVKPGTQDEFMEKFLDGNGMDFSSISKLQHDVFYPQSCSVPGLIMSKAGLMLKKRIPYFIFSTRR